MFDEFVGKLAALYSKMHPVYKSGHVVITSLKQKNQNI